MNIVVIRGRAIDPSVHKICASLSKNGYHVRLLLWDRQNSYNANKQEDYIIDRCLIRAPYDKVSAVLYFPLWILYQCIYLIKTDADVIHACDLDTIIPALVVNKIKRNILCYHIYDFYANNLTERIPKSIKTIVDSTEKYAINYCDAVILADEGRLEEINGAKAKKIVYLYNSPINYYPESLKLTEKNQIFTIFYGGLISYVRGIHHMIEAVQNYSDVNLILAGSVVDKAFFDLLKSKKNVKYIGWLESYDEIISETRKADILFRFSDPFHPKTKYESPNKLFEAMMCGIPIIVSDQSSMAKIVRDENCGIVIQYGNIDEIKNAIQILKNNKDQYYKLSNNGERAYRQKYNWDIMEKRLVELYDGFKRR